MTDPFRCSAASAEDAESMVGTAPTEPAILCLEYAGPWGRKALAESRLAIDVREGLADLDGVRVQLVRRHGGMPGARPSRARDERATERAHGPGARPSRARDERATERAHESGPGVRVFASWLGDGDPWVETTVLDHAGQVLDLDLDALVAGRSPGLTPYSHPLWLVCTNGRRDRCCAEAGRPITGALAARWPDETWETTHLGGHRFAGTVLALPAGVCLGRLDAGAALDACQELALGRYPLEVARGRAGLPAAAQVAVHEVRERAGSRFLDAVVVEAVGPRDGGGQGPDGPHEGVVVTGQVDGREFHVEVAEEPGPVRRQSCGDDATKPTVLRRVVDCRIG